MGFYHLEGMRPGQPCHRLEWLRISFLFNLGVNGARCVHGCANDDRAYANAMSLGRRQVFVMTLYNRRSGVITTDRIVRQVVTICFLRERLTISVFRTYRGAPTFFLTFRSLTAFFGFFVWL